MESGKTYKANKADWLDGAWSGLGLPEGDERKGETGVPETLLERDLCSHAVHRVGTRGRVALARQRCDHAIGRSELDLIGARRQIGEGVVALLVGCGLGDDVTVDIQQRDRDAFDSRLAQILHAVAIEVVPHRVAQRGADANGVGGILVGDLGRPDGVTVFIDGRTGDGSDVHISTEADCAGDRTGHRSTWGQLGGRAGRRAFDVIGDRNVGQRHIAGVGHHVQPGHRIAVGEFDAGCGIRIIRRIDRVHVLLDIDRRVGYEGVRHV